VLQVKGVLMESKLPLETLGKIWDLADQDKDGMLDRHEFLVVSYLSLSHKCFLVILRTVRKAHVKA
jgi:predicted acetyltransferase